MILQDLFQLEIFYDSMIFAILPSFLLVGSSKNFFFFCNTMILCILDYLYIGFAFSCVTCHDQIPEVTSTAPKVMPPMPAVLEVDVDSMAVHA